MGTNFGVLSKFCPKTNEVTDLEPQTLYNEEFRDSFVLRAIVGSEI